MTLNVNQKFRIRNVVFGTLLLIFCMAFPACSGGSQNKTTGESGMAVEMHAAENLRIENKAGYTEVTVRNPWDTVRTLQRYLLIDRDSVIPDILPEGIVIRTPVGNALVGSSVHTSLISELGAKDAIGGVFNVQYIYDPELQSGISSGTIIDCGISVSPDLEKIIGLRPDVIMLSPYENSNNSSKVGTLGIPIVECADYMETSPLGRAEWVKFYGLLFGKQQEGERMFAKTEEEYNQLKSYIAGVKKRPKVLLDQRYGQVWNVPGGQSTMGILIEDAGGVNPFAGYRKSGSVALAPEKVLGEAHDADVWLVRYNQNVEKTLSELASDAAVNSQFKAYRDGNVYGCNTRFNNYFDETSFHPELLLREMIMVIHPGLLGEGETLYYKKMK